LIDRRGWLGLATLGAVAPLAPVALSGCGGRLLEADAPVERPWTSPPRTAWVFSSGGPRAFVHVGVLKALEEIGVLPDVVVGASGGAIVGTLCAAGLKARQLQNLAMDLQPTAVVRLSMSSPGRLSASGLAEWVRDQVEATLQRPAPPVLERLAMRAVCVAYRPRDARVVAFTAGDVGAAVAASCAIEGRFAPVSLAGESYVDADLHMPMPVRVARRLGARRVMAIDASAHDGSAPPSAPAEWLAGDRRKRALTEPDAQAADLVLHPRLPYYASITPEYRAHVIEIGYRDTLQQVARIRALHAA
jgi:NTE family protein